VIKLSLFVVLAPLILLACASNPNTPVSSPSSNASGGSPDIAQVSSGGGVPCAQEIALDCPSGVDGCLNGQTSMHVCVAASAHAGPSCSQEVALECSAGEVDACTLSPAAAPNHICVRQ
jgi:hypothetical protein